MTRQSKIKINARANRQGNRDNASCSRRSWPNTDGGAFGRGRRRAGFCKYVLDWLAGLARRHHVTERERGPGGSRFGGNSDGCQRRGGSGRVGGEPCIFRRVPKYFCVKMERSYGSWRRLNGT